MNFTFLPGSIIGYVGYPEALFVRSLAAGLVRTGYQVRVVEERRNELLTTTLKSVGSGAYRHFYDAFPGIQFHTYEPRTGPRLLEWVSREMAISDVIVVVNGIPEELCRWIANLEQPGSLRIYLSYRPELLDDAMVSAYEINAFEAVLATGEPKADIDWLPIYPGVDERDSRYMTTDIFRDTIMSQVVPRGVDTAEFLQVIDELWDARDTVSRPGPNCVTPRPRARPRTGVEPNRGE